MGLEAFADAVGNFTELSIWLWILGGTFWGLLFGLVPGIGALTGMALFLPFVFRLQPMEALPLMVTLAAVGFTGGSITAVLLGIPGESPNIATTFDGFPMTQKGEGGRALGAALMSSVLGGVAPVFLALAMVIAVLPLVMALTSMDMVFVIIIGLSFIALVGRGSMLKGLISGGIGMMISFIGLATVTGIPRFTFGIAYLYDGINLIPIGLGLFAIPPMVELAVKEAGGAWTAAVSGMRDVWKGARDVFRHWPLWLRSSLIGYVFGVIPGVGSNVAVFVAYGQAKQSSKQPQLFGTGIVEAIPAAPGTWIVMVGLQAAGPARPVPRNQMGLRLRPGAGRIPVPRAWATPGNP